MTMVKEGIFIGIHLTHIRLASFLWDLANSADLDQMPQRAASDQGRSPLFAYRMFYQNLNKIEKYHPTSLKTEMDWSN